MIHLVTGVHPPKPMMHIELSPYFPKICNSPIFAEFMHFPLFSFNLRFFFFSPYFDHDAFMHHASHILNAPAFWGLNQKTPLFTDDIFWSGWYHTGFVICLSL